MYRQRVADMSPAPGLKVSDLDVDGRPEAIIGRGGAYAELALHDATVDGKPKWRHLLAASVTCVEAADVNQDGKHEVIAGSPSGWLTVFALEGAQVWTTPMPHEICAVAPMGETLFVACADGNVYQVNPDGHIIAQHRLGGTPSSRSAASTNTSSSALIMVASWHSPFTRKATKTRHKINRLTTSLWWNKMSSNPPQNAPQYEGALICIEYRHGAATCFLFFS